jgi:hypothetical protein
LLVPVQFADHAVVESHVDAGDFDGRAEFADGGLPSPSSFLSP